MRVRITLDKLEQLQEGWISERSKTDMSYTNGWDSWFRSKNVELEIIQQIPFLISNDPEKITELLLRY